MIYLKKNRKNLVLVKGEFVNPNIYKTLYAVLTPIGIVVLEGDRVAMGAIVQTLLL